MTTLSRHSLPTYAALAAGIEQLVGNPSVSVPPRLVQKLAGASSLFVMPASNERIAITKLITYVADNATRGLPTIQGDIVVFDVKNGKRLAILDGPTITARRTAAVSLLAAQKLAKQKEGPLLIVGAGVQGLAHLEAFHEGLGVTAFGIASRNSGSVERLVTHAQKLGLRAWAVDDANAALADYPLIVSTTSAQQVALHALPHPDAFIAAVGAFTPAMVEWAPEVCRHIHNTGTIVVDSRDADHEAGDLLQACLDVAALPTLGDVVTHSPRWTHLPRKPGPVFFKSCGWAGWDLAAADCMVSHTMQP
jgi:ornithine cyclodeaminase